MNCKFSKFYTYLHLAIRSSYTSLESIYIYFSARVIVSARHVQNLLLLYVRCSRINPATTRKAINLCLACGDTTDSDNKVLPQVVANNDAEQSIQV